MLLKIKKFFSKKNYINTKYSPQLDHIRAIAAFLVFTWHFITFNDFHRTTPDTFFFPISILTEGHTGVVLFMTLSGYLFSKVFEDKKVIFKYFYLNRLLRLIPLLIIIIIVNLTLVNEFGFGNFLKKLCRGFYQNWDYGAWSVSVEFKYYYFIPLILYFLNQDKKNLFLLIFFSIIFNIFLYLNKDAINLKNDFQYYAYYSIIGHLNEFLIGMLSYRYRHYLKNYKKSLLLSTILFLFFYNYFEKKGGFYDTPDQKIWIILPTIQGFYYAFLISFYDNNNFNFLKTKISNTISKVGVYSYSIYLWHFFFVFSMPKLINDYFIKIDNLYTALVLSFFSFIPMILLGAISYNVIEKPFLKLRKKYVF